MATRYPATASWAAISPMTGRTPPASAKKITAGAGPKPSGSDRGTAMVPSGVRTSNWVTGIALLPEAGRPGSGTKVTVPVGPGGQAVPRVLTAELGQRPAYRVAQLPDQGRWRGRADDLVHHLGRGQVGGADALAAGQLGGVAGVPEHDRAGPLGSQRSQPGVGGGHRPVGGQQGQGG